MMAVDNGASGKKNKHVPHCGLTLINLPYRTQTVLAFVIRNQQRVEKFAVLYASQ